MTLNERSDLVTARLDHQTPIRSVRISRSIKRLPSILVSRPHIPSRLRSLSRLLAHQSNRQLSHINALVLVSIFVSTLTWSVSDCSEPIRSTAAGWNHIVNLLLANLHLVRVVEEARFATCLVLGVIEGALLNRLSSSGNVGVGTSARCDSSDVGSITILAFHWLCNGFVKVHHQIVIYGILVRRLGITSGSDLASSLSSPLIGCDPLTR